MNKILKVHPSDNVIVALTDLKKGEVLALDGESYTLTEDIAAKHKFAARDFAPGDEVQMYGVLVGKAQNAISRGSWLNVFNTKHAANPLTVKESTYQWLAPDVSKYENATFKGFHRSDGSVGTANYWLVVPLVFCENHNVDTLKKALTKALGYETTTPYQDKAEKILAMIQAGQGSEILQTELPSTPKKKAASAVFPNVDGIKFITHQSGCGGTRQDAQALCGLLAGYITHPNVAGATVLSLGCQNAEESILIQEIEKRVPGFDRPVHILNHQTLGGKDDIIDLALKQTLLGLKEANELQRTDAPLSKLCVGLECGGSDGFSGISANPTLGYFSDMLVALQGKVMLAEFPELCGVEQNLADRCVDRPTAERFAHLMSTYSQRATAAGSGFDMNPSPGNIKDGLITDAIKSAGAAKKGGSSPVVDVLDYPEKATKPGLTLLCTPGNDVESTTAEVGSGATVVLFTTGLGTPTGNPIAPVVKVASNSKLFNKMHDIMDFNTGGIIEGSESIPAAAERLMDFVISVASGETTVKAVLNTQDDFIPWKRGVSL
ncbi:UxaA family hydrolase [Persicitalea jodogahamensis]|uniref:Dehydratase n=1 Tax=Persicitalea jodogahamensis TaxID=402147 RepID=A0A8J3D8B6_9BACT|nr:altronate dehydratase family protein [Persicitalea jodogahamensis]GHB60587.1 dehydratase [Persicitalea jodogahamensis]